MIRNNFSTFKTAFILLAFFLPSCEDKQEQKQECDAVCEVRKADFELLTSQVIFRNGGEYYFYFYVYKTATGAIARYEPFYGEEVETELSPEEWLNFIKALYKCLDKDLNEWGGEDKYRCDMYPLICKRVLAIDYLDSSKKVGYNALKARVVDWDMVEKTISDMLPIIRKRAEVPLDAKLRAEYQKRFGEPITDVELSTNGIYFLFAPNKTKNILSVLVNRTETGAILRYTETGGILRRDVPEVELDIDEWLDFVRAMHKSGISKWERQYGGDTIRYFYDFYSNPVSKFDERWKIEIYYSDKAGSSLTEGYDAYPPKWDEFMRIMDRMKVKFTQ
jgi:hypothetical protein